MTRRARRLLSTGVAALALATSVVTVTAFAATTISADGRSPCRLASPAAVKAAFGGKVGAGKIDNSIPGAPTCRFAIKGSNLGLGGSAVVFITPGQTAGTFALAKKDGGRQANAAKLKADVIALAKSVATHL